MSALAAYGMASAGVNLYSGISGMGASNKLAKQQKELGELQSSLILEETEETLRRTDIEDKAILSAGEATVAASGFSKGSSQDVYMASMAGEMRNQRNWTEKSGRSKASMAKKGAGYTADSLKSQGRSQMFNGVTGAMSGFVTAGKN